MKIWASYIVHGGRGANPDGTDRRLYLQFSDMADAERNLRAYGGRPDTHDLKYEGTVAPAKENA